MSFIHSAIHYIGSGKREAPVLLLYCSPVSYMISNMFHTILSAYPNASVTVLSDSSFIPDQEYKEQLQTPPVHIVLGTPLSFTFFLQSEKVSLSSIILIVFDDCTSVQSKVTV